MKIGYRLGIGFSLIFLLLFSLILFSINRMIVLSDPTELIYNHPLTVSNAVLRINANIIRIHRSMQDAVFAEDPARIEVVSIIIDDLEKDIYLDFEIINERFLGEKAKYTSALNLFKQWKPRRDKVMALILAGNKREAAAITRGKGEDNLVKMEKAMEAMGDFARQKAIEFRDTVGVTRNKAFKTIYLILILSVVLCISLAYYIVRSITHPLKAVKYATTRIGKGDLDTVVSVDSADELGELGDSINKMSENLKIITASRDQLNSEIESRKQTEQELKTALSEVARSNEELERFAYIASHDLKEPLRSISGFTDLLATRYKGKLDKNADDFIDFILDGTSRMDQLINDLLAYSRVTAGKKDMETVACFKIITRVIGNLSVVIEKANAKITFDELPAVIANDMQLEQLLQNLISNGIKFHRETPPLVHVSAAKNHDEWVFSVKDNGIGIDAEHSAKIFDMFKRLHGRSTYEGTGIGLAICKKIVELHRGRIWVESENGNGSTFYFTLPG